MLTRLKISNFALLNDVEVEFGAGLNVLTGETGAGKSLLIDAVSLLRGGRASAEVVRTGADEARVEAIFEPPHGPAAEALQERLRAVGIRAGDEGLLVKRVIAASGRGRVYLNGELATVAQLAEVVGVLIELAGQHEHQTLTQPAAHLEILDAFAQILAEAGDAKLKSWLSTRNEFADSYEKLQVEAAALSRLEIDEKARVDRIEFLRFQLAEFEQLGEDQEELAKLTVIRDRLRGSRKLAEGTAGVEERLYSGEAAIIDALNAQITQLAELEKFDPALADSARNLSEARLLLEEAAREIGRYASQVVDDPELLEQTEERLNLLHGLVRKHRVQTLAELMGERTRLAAEAKELENMDQTRGERAARVTALRKIAVALAADLSRFREHAAVTLSTRVNSLLSELAMTGATLKVEVLRSSETTGESDEKRLGPFGWDRVEFLFAPNRGEKAQSLARIASGGELSRILLAFKRVLSRADRVATYVFDEIDTGIGGAVADTVGAQIRQVAQEKQVLCITHLPQIAAYGDAHFRVEKRERDGRVETIVRPLPEKDRTDELARMLGGATITASARAHAREMLKISNRKARTA